jgi:Zn-dependent protease
MLGDLSPTFIVVLIICLLVSLVIHEFMHAYASHQLGDTTARDQGRLTLNPLSHIDPFMTVVLPIVTLIIFQVPFLAAKPVPFDPGRVKFDEFGAAIIAAAGPLSNLVLAFLAALILHSLSLGSFMVSVLQIFISLNVTLFVFNLIPIPPLDGSRVLYALAPESVQDFMRSIEPYGFFIIMGLVFMAGLGNLVGDISQYVLNLLP